MVLYGVDVHGSYQAGISFPRLAAEGYSFAVVKATEGTGFRAPRFREWVRAARSAGLVAGAYHWLKAGDGAAQARFFHGDVAAAGGPAGMLIQLDCEDDASLGTLRAWAAEWRRLTGDHPFLIYTGGWWWRPRGWPGAGVTPYLWASHYLWDPAAGQAARGTAAQLYPRVPAGWWVPGYGGWTSATILQFTDRGNAGGLAANVDLNAFRGTREQLLALTRAGAPAPIPGGAVEAADRVNYVIEQWRRPEGSQTVGGRFINGLIRNVAEVQDRLARVESKVDALGTAFAALAEQMQTGGGELDTAAVLNRIDERAGEDAAVAAAQAAQLAELQAQVSELTTERDELRARLAADRPQG